MDTNTIIEGTVKFRDGKKWKSRWCVVRKLSPVADCIHLQLYRDSKERYKQGQTKASLSLENFLGIQSGFTLDKESNTLAIICQDVTVVLAFDTREHLMQWQVKITANLGEGDHFLVQISSAPPRTKLSPGPARLLIQEFQFCLTVGLPPRLIAFWQIRQLRKYGVVEGKFCFEGGSRCGRGEGLYVLVSEKPEDLKKAFDLAAEGKLFTRKRPVARNMSVMEKVRKHHTLRPESQLSDVSSLDSTIVESHTGCDATQNYGCSLSREDLLGDSFSNCESNRFDLKNFWNTEVGIGRCTSCMSKLGSMSRSSTLTATPCSSFPAWTMDRPKSCGSQKMSPSVTCSSISLSSHSSRGSSCGNRHSTVDNCTSICSSSRSMCTSTPVERSLSPPTRPPKPAHLSLLRLHLTPTTEQQPSSPSVPFSPASPHTCCCGRVVSPVNSPYGNYDVPKPLNFVNPKLKLEVKTSPVKTNNQAIVNEYYDTPRKLKENLIWEYGNYDVPPPAQPILSASKNSSTDESGSRKALSESPYIGSAKERDLTSLHLNLKEEPVFHINKVKLTGQGRMPVMSPCGKIIENLEPTYEEKLEILLENESLSTDSSCSYANVGMFENNHQEFGESTLPDNNQLNKENNYSNFNFIQSAENYENFKCLFLDKPKTILENNTIKSCDNVLEDCDCENNRNIRTDKDSCSNFCSNCSHFCTKTDISLEKATEKVNNITNCQTEHAISINGPCLVTNNTESAFKNTKAVSQSILENKCSSTSCLHDIKINPLNCSNVSVKNTEGLKDKCSLKCSVSATNSPDHKKLQRFCTEEQLFLSQFKSLSLRKRSNSADSARISAHMEDESGNKSLSSNSFKKSCGLNTPSPTDFFLASEKVKYGNENHKESELHIKLEELKTSPLKSERKDLSNTLQSKPKLLSKYSDLVSARRSSSVPNKFFSNRDSSSSNDSGVSTGSLSLKHCGADFLEFEMPLTTCMSSKRHHIAMVNSAHQENNNEVKYALPKRSKSVDPLRDLTFTFELGEQQSGKSISAEAEVPVFFQENRNKDYLSPLRNTALPDSRSTSSGTSDMSDYFETLSFSSFSSLDCLDSSRFGRASATTMKPRSGKEYHKIDRYLLSQETKQ